MKANGNTHIFFLKNAVVFLAFKSIYGVFLNTLVAEVHL